MIRLPSKYTRIVLALGALLLASCSLDKTGAVYPVEMGSRPAKTILEAVQRVQAVGTKAGCNSCHAGGGPLAWMTDDPVAAVDNVTGLIDINTPSQSRLAQRSQDGHYAGSAQRLSMDDWMNVINGVVLMEKSQNTTPTGPVDTTAGWLATADIPVPDTLPNYPSYSTLQMPLSAINPAFGTSYLEIRVSNESTLPGDISFWNFKVYNTTAAGIGVDGIILQLNDISNPLEGRSLKDLVTIVPAGTSPVISVPRFLMTSLGTGMRVRALFRALTVTATPVCKNLDNWANNVLPIISTANRLLNANGTTNANTCLGCHGGGNTTAYTAFDLRGTDNATRCQQFLARSTPTNPTASPVLIKPTINPPHPVFLNFNATDYNTIVNWIAAEQ